MARDDHDGKRLVHRAQTIEHFEAVHAGHLDVEQHEIGTLALDERESLLPCRGPDEVVALVLERHPQGVADGGFVIDDKDAGFRHRGGGVVPLALFDADRLELPLIDVGRVDVESQNVAGTGGASDAAELADRLHRLAVDLEQHVAALNVGVER